MKPKPGQSREPRSIIVDSGGVAGYALTMWLTSQGHQAAHAGVEQAADRVRAHRATSVLIDTAVLTAAQAQDCVCQLRKISSLLVIIVLADEPALASTEAWARRCGADGVLSADIAPSRLARLLSSTTPQLLLAKYAVRAATASERHDAAGSQVSRLTQRERQVLACLTDGATTESIAERLGISVNTVRTHVQNMLSKLGVRSRLELAAIGRTDGGLQLARAA